MTQMAQAGQRGNLVASALVAAAVSGVITVSGLMIAGEITLAGAPTTVESAQDASLERLISAERAWEAQRRVQSAEALRYERYLEQLGAEWQLRYEQTNPNR